MPRSVLRNRVQGCIVESHVGGQEADEFRVLAADETTPIVSLPTMAAAIDASKAITGARSLAGTLGGDLDKFGEFATALQATCDETHAALAEQKARAEQKEQEKAKAKAEREQEAKSSQQPPQAAGQPATQQPEVNQSTQQQPSQQPATQQQQQPTQQPATQTQQQPVSNTPDTPQEPTDGGADPGRVHTGDQAPAAGEGSDSPDQAAPAPASTPDTAGSEEPASGGVSPAPSEPAPEDGGINLL